MLVKILTSWQAGVPGRGDAAQELRHAGLASVLAADDSDAGQVQVFQRWLLMPSSLRPGAVFELVEAVRYAAGLAAEQRAGRVLRSRAVGCEAAATNASGCRGCGRQLLSLLQKCVDVQLCPSSF